MEYNLERNEGKLTVTMPKEVDHHCANQIRMEADLLIDTYHVRKLIFDFSHTEFMDSSGIGVIIGRSRNMGFTGGQVIAENMNQRVEQIFRVAGLNKLITVIPSKEKEENHVTVTFDAISQNEAFARMVVAAFLTGFNPTLDQMTDVKTAVSEAVTNAIIHGYDGKGGKILMTCQQKGQDLTVAVQDKGKGIADIKKARQPFYTSRPALERSGMGFAFMEAFMDDVEVISEVDVGTTIIMRKKIGAQDT